MPSHRSPGDSPLAIEVQLRQEKASSLQRTGDKLEKLIGELSGVAAELERSSGAQRILLVTRYRRLRAEAEHQRWCLIVQREAMGLWNHAEVDLMYCIPPPLGGN